MYLIMGREAMDTHFKLVMPILQPKPGQKESKLQLIMNAAKYYAKWYPSLYFPKMSDFNVKYLSPSNQAQLRYIERQSRKLARVLFHTMGKYKEKLEFEQCILGNFVEIGVDLFAMAAVLALAEARLSENPADQTPQELADLFCKNARVRIRNNFRAVGDNHNHSFDKVTETLMNGEFKWMYERDVYQEIAPEFRGEGEPAHAPRREHAHEPVGAK
jgi:hypothetical protein